MASDRVRIEGLRACGILGVHPEERIWPREIVVDLELTLDLRPAGRSDRLSDTVDYAVLAREARTLIERSSFELVEALAEALAGLCLAEPRIERVRVRVAKPGALPEGTGVAIEIEREREALR